MPRRHLLCATSLVVTLTCAPAQAVDYVTSATMAFHAFPEADTVRRIARDVDRAARREIERRLPFRVHFEELGTHELHVVFRGQVPVGLLYSRSEETDWGLAEIGWAMSLEGEVLGFEFANKRSGRADEIARSPFAASLVGQGFDGLVALHARSEPEATHLDDTPSRRRSNLTRTVLRSALKATIVTEVVWKDEVDKLADRAMLFEEFPGAIDGRRYVANLPPRAQVPRRITSLRIMEARGRGGFALGTVARVRIRIGEEPAELRWVLDASGTVMRVKPTNSWAGEELLQACSAMQGHRLDEVEPPVTPLQEAAIELSRELVSLRDGRRHK